MPEVKLTIKLVERLDIHIGRLVGIVKENKYRLLVEEYDLDMTQCSLWWDIAQLLAHVLENNDYEDLECDYQRFGLEAKKVLAEQDEKFLYIKQLLAQYEILHDNEAIGRILAESIEDADTIYRSIKKDISGLLTTQDEINRIVDTE